MRETNKTAGTSWRTKLSDKLDLPKVEPISDRMSEKWGNGTIAVPAPREVDEIMWNVPKGNLITINEIRGIIAKKHMASIGCPITTGLFAWVAANAAAEDEAEGRNRITPYWRTLKSGGELNAKYPGGVENQKTRLEQEGFNIVRKGNRYVVKDYKRYLIQL